MKNKTIKEYESIDKKKQDKDIFNLYYYGNRKINEISKKIYDDFFGNKQRYGNSNERRLC